MGFVKDAVSGVGNFFGGIGKGVGRSFSGTFDPANGSGFKASYINPETGQNLAPMTDLRSAIPGVAANDVLLSGYGVGDSIGNQQRFVDALQRANSIDQWGSALQNLGGLYGQQQGLANQLQAQANGQGPNPSQDMLNQATRQNVLNQRAMMASQRGAGGNPALLARQAAQQGSMIQQQAAGQAATMNSQQRLAALQALQGQQGMMGNTLGAQGQMAGQIAGMQGQGLQNITGNNMNMYNTKQNLFANQQRNQLAQEMARNEALVNMQSNVNNANAGIGQVNAAAQGRMWGGLFDKAGSAVAGAAMAAHGGRVGYWDGGSVGADQMPSEFDQLKTPEMDSKNPQNLAKNMVQKDSMAGLEGDYQKVHQFTPMMSFVHSFLSEYSHPSQTKQMAFDGGKIGGTPEYRGNDYRNDRVPIMASPGEIIIPNSITQSKDAAEKAKRFVEAIMMREKKQS